MYSQRIAFLEDSLRLIEERMEKGDTSLVDEKVKYKKELSRVRKLQWEHDHESIDLDRDY